MLIGVGTPDGRVRGCGAVKSGRGEHVAGTAAPPPPCAPWPGTVPPGLPVWRRAPVPGLVTLISARAAPASSTAPPTSSAVRRPARNAGPCVAPWLTAAKMAPSTATPSAAPNMRAKLAIPEANPARSALTADTATPTTGPVLSARPIPTMTKATSISARLAAPPSTAYSSTPMPINDIPPVIGRRGPIRETSRPTSGDSRTNTAGSGSNSSPAVSALAPRSR